MQTGAQDRIDALTADIEATRKTAKGYVIWGWVFGAVGVVFFLTGAIRGLAETTLGPKTPLAGLNFPGRLAATAWLWLDSHIGFLWSALLNISPYPLLTQPVYHGSWVTWICTFLGFLLLGAAAYKHATKLRKNADKAETALGNQSELMLQMERLFMQMPGATVGVAGQGNAVQINQTIVNIKKDLHKSDKEKWYKLPGGIVLLWRHCQSDNAPHGGVI